MANRLRGEVTVPFSGRAYTLRPSFHILTNIEERIGLSIPRLAMRLHDRGLLASEILMILVLATRHDGSDAFDSEAALNLPTEAVDLHALVPPLAEFLALALGGRTGGEIVPARDEETDDAPLTDRIDWERLFETAITALKLSPADFWALTMPEFRLLLRGARRKTRMNNSITPEDMQALAARFPDKHAA